MKITITVDQLIKLNACQEGIEDFKREFGDSIALDWTPETQIQLIKGSLRKWFGWAVFNKLLPLWSMSGADLSGADLSGANLSGADLSLANLSGAKLSWADLSEADLSWADLSGADLSGADLSGANLSGADLSRAIVSEEQLVTTYKRL
jgi:uncharacterized protein YjbI with pentapeptide repeats